MAESKSTDFPFAINDHSEKLRKFDLFEINGLEAGSEWAARRRSQPTNPIGMPVTVRSRVFIDFGNEADIDLWGGSEPLRRSPPSP
jgi:hypothetical protein